MWNPFKKKRIMRDIYSEEKALLYQVRSFFLDEQHAEERALIAARAKHIEELLKKIAPWKKLKLGAYAKRITIAVVIYLLFMIPVGLYFLRDFYSQTQLVNNTEGIGERVETQYVPVTTVDVMSGSFVQRKVRSQPKELEVNPGQGIDAGMAVAILEGTENGTIETLWTAPRDGKRVLLRQTQDEKLNPLKPKEDPIVLISDLDIVAASAFKRSDGHFVVASAINNPSQQIVLQIFSSEWKPVGQRISVEANKVNEYVGGVQVSEWGTRIAVVTSIIPGEEASILDAHEPMLRVFEADLSLAYEAPIRIGGFHTDIFAKLITRTEQNRFYIISSGRPLIDEGNGERGSELYAFEFASDGTPVEYFKLTNNGRPHDFWTSGTWFDERTGYTYVTNHRIPAPGFSHPDYSVKFPKNTATNYVHVLDENLNMLGTVNIDETGSEEGKPFGFTHTRIHKVNNRIYALYDKIIKDRDEGTESRILITRYLDITL